VQRKLKTISRVTVFAEGVLEQTILQLCLKLGAHGYTVLDCRGGKGEHALVEKLFDSTPERVRIELLVEPDVAEKIMTLLASDQFIRRPVLACLETVQVMEGVHY
jgi:hypothetical protein